VNGFHRTFVEWEVAGIPRGPCSVFGPESEEPKETTCNGIPGKPRDFWKREWVRMDDGGCTMFRAAFDIESLTVRYVDCNGTA
jgi:hypothetical protein